MKNKNASLPYSLFLSITLSCVSISRSAHALPCANPLSGSWNFGTVPTFCNVSPLQLPSFVDNQYRAVTFDDSKNGKSRSQYMSMLYPVVREVGMYYIRRRNPKVGAAEIEGFQAALFALVSQESYWSHYRKGTDGIIRSMRGDSLHGYGIMQLDDRSHATAIKNGTGTDLIFNMVAGLDAFYAQWVRSATISCVPSPTDFRDRARAAWAAYNGGPGSICRWKNTRSKWAKNDREFFDKLVLKPYLPFVANTNAPSPLDVSCLAQGVRPCANK